MNWKKHDYDAIPGTYVFNGETAHRAYALNKLLFSFNDAGNRDDYARDPAAYADRFGLPAAQKRALVEEDYLELIRMGANIYYLAKLAVPKGFTMQDTGAAFQGITRDEFQAKLDERAADLEARLEKAGGFWNG
jgi:protocatechuate 4,5-dioxygenase alpha chain